MNHLKPFDYASSALGLLGTMLTLGVFGNVPKLLIVVTEVFSAIICLFSLGPLILNLWVHSLEPLERRLYNFHLLVNLAPTIYLLAHLTETPWEKFTT